MAVNLDLVQSKNDLIRYLKDNNSNAHIEFSTRAHGYSYVYILALITIPNDDKKKKMVTGVFGIMFDRTAKINQFAIESISAKLKDENKVEIFINGNRYVEGTDPKSLHYDEFFIADKVRTREFMSFGLRDIN